jgi:hypothetical protein
MSSATIGVGAIILIGLWSSSFILCLLSFRTRHSIGPIVFVSTIFISIILLSIPRSSTDSPKLENKVCKFKNHNLFILSVKKYVINHIRFCWLII